MEHWAKIYQVHLFVTFFQIRKQHVEYFYPQTECRCVFRTLSNIYDEFLLRKLLTSKSRKPFSQKAQS